jgi:CoB--CoM heterodisulfide reductase subunit B
LIKHRSESHSYSLFTGCLIPSKFPFIELATRKVMDRLKVSLQEMPGATCCPNQMAIKSTDNDLWLSIAGRNLALAEQIGYDILSLCNGCYNTLKTVNSILKSESSKKEMVREKLSKVNLTFQGTIEVKHIIEVLVNDIGANAIEREIQRPLDGLVGATFFGCHVIRPEDHMGFDDPKKPQSLDRLTALLGLKVISYPEHNSCCGGGLKIARKDDALNFVRKTLLSMKSNGANCIVVTCPYCMVQLEFSQADIEDVFGDKIDLPVFYYTELLGLAFGFSPTELGLDMHNEIGVKNQTLLNDVLGISPTPGHKKISTDEIFDSEVTSEQLEICQKCKACMDDCYAAMTTDYNPDELIDLVLTGNAEALLQRGDIWNCLNCHQCIDQCPQGFGMVKLIFNLKNFAISHGIYPEVIGHRGTELSHSGYAFAPQPDVREKMNLPARKGADINEIKKFLDDSNVENLLKSDDEVKNKMESTNKGKKRKHGQLEA